LLRIALTWRRGDGSFIVARGRDPHTPKRACVEYVKEMITSGSKVAGVMSSVSDSQCSPLQSTHSLSPAASESEDKVKFHDLTWNA
jgi:hypothetical protein